MRPAKVDVRRVVILVVILVVIVLVVVRFGSKLTSGDDGLQVLERLDNEYSNYETDSDEMHSPFNGDNSDFEKNEKEIDYEFDGPNVASKETKNVLQSINSEESYDDESEDNVNVEFGRWSSYSGHAFESSSEDTRSAPDDVSATIVENIVAHEANDNHIDTMANEIEDSVNVEFGRWSSYSGHAFESSSEDTRSALEDVPATIVENIVANGGNDNHIDTMANEIEDNVNVEFGRWSSYSGHAYESSLTETRSTHDNVPATIVESRVVDEANDNHNDKMVNEIDVETYNDGAKVDVYESNTDEEIMTENVQDARREGVGGVPMATGKHDAADYLPHPLVTNRKVERDNIDYKNNVAPENVVENEHYAKNENNVDHKRKLVTENNVDLENNGAQEN